MSEIRELRLRKGYSLQTLARAIGASPSAISRWERGERVPTRLEQIVALAEALGVPVEELVRMVLARQKEK